MMWIVNAVIPSVQDHTWEYMTSSPWYYSIKSDTNRSYVMDRHYLCKYCRAALQIRWRCRLLLSGKRNHNLDTVWLQTLRPNKINVYYAIVSDNAEKPYPEHLKCLNRSMMSACL